MATTQHLNLITTSVQEGDTKTFRTYREELSGDIVSNMTKIDDAFLGLSGEVDAQGILITEVQSGLSSLSNVDNTSDTAKPVSTATQTALNLKANLASPTFTGTVSGVTKTHVGLSNVDNTSDTAKPVSTATQTALNLKQNSLNFVPEDSSKKGSNNGYASLGSDGKVPNTQLPSYVDDVLEFATLSGFPGTGESSKIYIDLSTNKTYRWSGTVYVEISASIVLGTTSATAYRGDLGNTAYVHSQSSHDYETSVHRSTTAPANTSKLWIDTN